MQRPPYQQALARLAILESLAEFGPCVVGTPPLGLDGPASDIDIVCHAPDAAAFAAVLWHGFSHHRGFSLRQWTGGGRPVIAGFEAEGWPFEVFGAAQPVRRQAGWRHFSVEQRLLALGGPPFRASVLQHRAQGLKTEPAFAAALGLASDPYEALLEWETWPDTVLEARLASRGFRIQAVGA